MKFDTGIESYSIEEFLVFLRIETANFLAALRFLGDWSSSSSRCARPGALSRF